MSLVWRANRGITIDEQRGVIITTDVNKDEPVIEFCMK